VKYDPKKHKDRTDLERVRRLTDEDIAKAVASDPDAAPLLTKEWFRHARVMPPLTKKGIFVRLDPDILDWFKRQGPRYQTRMNAALRAFMEAHGPPRAKRADRTKAGSGTKARGR
jgi:uncharacterized protein (DUF4415 family)